MRGWSRLALLALDPGLVFPAHAGMVLAPATPRVAARDSKRPTQTPLAVAPTSWARFADATKRGRFDLA